MHFATWKCQIPTETFTHSLTHLLTHSLIHSVGTQEEQ